MLIPMAVLRGIEAGEIDLAFRTWTKPAARTGGSQTTPIGVLAVESVELVDPADITDDDARRSGAASGDALRADLAKRSGDVYRIRFRLAGQDPRIALRENDELSDAELATLTKKLQRLDRSSTVGPWTRATLELIRAHPERRAGDLADMVGRERDPFKLDVRKLKHLGLTESLLVGYRISPRGAAVLTALAAEDQ